MPSPDPLAAWLKHDAHATRRHQEAYARVNFGAAAADPGLAAAVQSCAPRATTEKNNQTKRKESG